MPAYDWETPTLAGELPGQVEAVVPLLTPDTVVLGHDMGGVVAAMAAVSGTAPRAVVLARGHLLVEDMLRPGHFRLVDSLRVPLYRQWLATTTGTELANLLVTCGGLRRLSLNQVFAYGERAQVVALLRARVLGGARAPEIQAYRATPETSH